MPAHVRMELQQARNDRFSLVKRRRRRSAYGHLQTFVPVAVFVRNGWLADIEL